MLLLLLSAEFLSPWKASKATSLSLWAYISSMAIVISGRISFMLSARNSVFVLVDFLARDTDELLEWALWLLWLEVLRVSFLNIMVEGGNSKAFVFVLFCWI